MKHALILCTFVSLGLARLCSADTSNGNDFALAYSEAKTPGAQASLLKDAQGRPHFFRYLKIQQMQAVTGEGQSGIQISAIEPSSDFGVNFTVTLPVSLRLLQSDPASKVGDAIAVTGRLQSIDPEKKLIQLEAPIVRHKDRLSPKGGKELISEIDPRAMVYSFTEGPRPLLVEARDKDLLQFRDKIIAEGGNKAWFEFLEKELNKRKAQRAREGKL